MPVPIKSIAAIEIFKRLGPMTIVQGRGMLQPLDRVGPPGAGRHFGDA